MNIKGILMDIRNSVYSSNISKFSVQQGHSNKRENLRGYGYKK